MVIKKDVTRRGVFEIGSWGLRYQIVDFNLNLQKITKRWFIGDYLIRILKYQDNDIIIDPNDFNRCLSYLNEFKNKCLTLGAEKILGIGTAPFRQAKNSSIMIKKIKSMTGLTCLILSQEDEGLNAYLTLSDLVGLTNLKNHPVLDLGGGSFQIIYYTDKYQYLTGSIAQEYVRAYLKKIKMVELDQDIYPLTIADTLKLHQHLEQELLYLKKTLFLDPKIKLYGIGVCRHFSTMLKDRDISRELLWDNIKKRAKMTYDQIINEFKQLRHIDRISLVGNAILVHALMKNLSLDFIKIYNIGNNTTGAILNKQFW